MNYFEAQIGHFSAKDIGRIIDLSSRNEVFSKFLEFNHITPEDIKLDIERISNVISAFLALETTEDSKYFYSTNEDVTESTLNERESDFIRNHSIYYRYFRYSFKEYNVDRIVMNGLIEDYFALCFILGTQCACSDTPIREMSINENDIFNKLINSFTGYGFIPPDAKKIIKPLVRYFLDNTIASEDAPLKSNFLQKIALINHGYQIVRLGSSVPALINDGEKATGPHIDMAKDQNKS